jgi:hypothetical protein
MSRSQETFLKKQREKERAQKKKIKQEKRDSKRGNTEKGLEIDWSSAPENNTLSLQERASKEEVKSNNLNK